jgi:anti-anti-sigma factor
MESPGDGHPVRDLPHDRKTPSTSRFRLAAELGEDSLELVLAGDLDMAATFKLEPEFDRLLSAKQVRRLVLDVADVEFIDSAGLGALLSIRDQTKLLGIEMTLINLSDPVRRILDLSGTSAIFRD